jgi:hypothetical protein
VQTSRGVIPFNALKPNIDGSSQCILPTDAGSRIGIMYVPQAGCPDKAEMHFIINGEDQGVCGKDIPYKAGPLRAVVDVYGTTKQVRIVQLYGGEYLSFISHFNSIYIIFICFNSVDVAKRMPRCYTAVHQEERSEFTSSAKTPEGILVVSIAMKIGSIPFIHTFLHDTFMDTFID